MRAWMMAAAVALVASATPSQVRAYVDGGTVGVVWISAGPVQTGHAIISTGTASTLDVNLTCGQVEQRSTGVLAGVLYGEGIGSDGRMYRIKAVAGGVGGTHAWGYTRVLKPRDPEALHCGADPIVTKQLPSTSANGTLYIAVYGYAASTFALSSADN